MKAERNEIWTSVYPAVRSHCLDHELDFSFVDMRLVMNVAMSVQFMYRIPNLDLFYNHGLFSDEMDSDF